MMKRVSDVKAECRVCGKSTPAEDFKMSVHYKMMVCPLCFSGKTAAEQEKKKLQEQQEKKPAGWDEVDEYLTKAARRKEQVISYFTSIPGSPLLKYACPRCKYVSKYDPDRMMPSKCSYCGEDISYKNKGFR